MYIMSKELLIIADAGGTKTQWLCYPSLDKEKEVIITTPGINASVSSSDSIAEVITTLSASIKKLDNDVKICDLFFYGAGCNSISTKNRLKKLFSEYLPFQIRCQEYYSDIEAAARAVYGDEAGLVCILGTGSASGVYDGKIIVDSIPSLGYIIGDEGSGAQMGKCLLNSFFKRELSNEINVKLEEFSDMDLSMVIEKVYRKPEANRYLASFIPFIKENEHHQEIDKIIDECLKLFFNKNVLKYKNRPSDRVRFVGSVACLFSERLANLSMRYELIADVFLQHPLKGLGEYYIQRADGKK